MSRLGTQKPDLARLLPHIEPEPNTGCWLWAGEQARAGYGSATLYGGVRQRHLRRMAHRAIYEILRGPIPPGLTLDHRCRVRACVNPDHLEPVTMRENVLRGIGLTAANARKTHCLRGHAFTPENTRLSTGPYGVQRKCRACANMASAQRARRLAAEA